MDMKEYKEERREEEEAVLPPYRRVGVTIDVSKTVLFL